MVIFREEEDGRYDSTVVVLKLGHAVSVWVIGVCLG